ncbi:hypothetical protein OU995_21855 [Roseateles sp. SL47]|uniref:hypothetical protein n=1 Tax=Roseateles sp. SL47 TaxID=2995138 RepID=UPI0022720AE7|nr:hypothetical protein [Roseateles sp. SL47]WAC72181.1 hypothetical protein OU995_21855 [Roseateles sp. SL47]
MAFPLNAFAQPAMPMAVPWGAAPSAGAAMPVGPLGPLGPYGPLGSMGSMSTMGQPGVAGAPMSESDAIACQQILQRLAGHFGPAQQWAGALQSLEGLCRTLTPDQQDLAARHLFPLSAGALQRMEPLRHHPQGLADALMAEGRVNDPDAPTTPFEGHGQNKMPSPQAPGRPAPQFQAAPAIPSCPPQPSWGAPYAPPPPAFTQAPLTPPPVWASYSQPPQGFQTMPPMANWSLPPLVPPVSFQPLPVPVMSPLPALPLMPPLPLVWDACGGFSPYACGSPWAGPSFSSFGYPGLGFQPPLLGDWTHVAATGLGATLGAGLGGLLGSFAFGHHHW